MHDEAEPNTPPTGAKTWKRHLLLKSGRGSTQRACDSGCAARRSISLSIVWRHCKHGGSKCHALLWITAKAFRVQTAHGISTIFVAQRMESTSDADRIQISEATADILCASGLSSLVTPRDDGVEIKGKRNMQTYWLATSAASSSDGLSSNAAIETDMASLEKRMHNRFGRGGSTGSSTARD